MAINIISVENIDQNYINRLNKRFVSLDTRKYTFGVGIQKERFQRIVRETGIGTKGGKISAAKFKKLHPMKKKALAREFSYFLENTTSKKIKENLEANKKTVNDTFLNAYDTDVSKLSDEQYENLWYMIHKLSRKYNESDYSNSATATVTELINEAKANDVSDSDIDSIFERILDFDRPDEGLNFLRELESRGFAFGPSQNSLPLKSF